MGLTVKPLSIFGVLNNLCSRLKIPLLQIHTRGGFMCVQKHTSQTQSAALHLVGITGVGFLSTVQEEPALTPVCTLVCMYARVTWWCLIINGDSETPSPLSISSSKTSGLTVLCKFLKTRVPAASLECLSALTWQLTKGCPTEWAWIPCNPRSRVNHFISNDKVRRARAVY